MSDHEKEKNVKLVEIRLDDEPVKIEEGTYTLAQFKERLKIPADKVVEMFVKGKFITLTDTSPIEVKAGEKFSTHVPRGGSSPWK